MGYNFFFAVGLLIFGPLSDRRGRRPVLLGGLAFYVAGSLACALAPSIEVLIVARIVQSLGAGAADAMTNAIVKDAFTEEKRQLAISFIQLMFIIGPVIAPIVGAWVVMSLAWRAAFWILSAAGVLFSFLALAFEESLPVSERYVSGAKGETLRQFAAVLKVPAFTLPLLVLAPEGRLTRTASTASSISPASRPWASPFTSPLSTTTTTSRTRWYLLM